MTAIQKVPRAKGKSVFKTIVELQKNILDFLEGNFESVGPTFRIKILHRNVIFSKDPEWFQHVVKTNYKNFKKGHVFDKMKPALGNGLLTSDDELWKQQRKLAQPTFYKKRLEGLMSVMMVIIKQHIVKWERLRDQNKEVYLDEALLDLTSDIVMSTLLGENFKDKLPQVSSLIHHMQKYVMKLIRIPLFKQYAMLTGEYQAFNKVKKEFDEVIYEIIKSRQATGKEYDDLLGMLMSARDESGKAMSTKQLRDEFITIFVAGHETTTYALGWAFYLLGKHPEKYAIMKEHAQNFDLDAPMNLQSYARLKYPLAIFKESMRIYAPAYVMSRQARQDDIIQNYAVGKNDAVILSVYHLQREAHLWNNPMKFEPERFMFDVASHEERNYYFPFGGGPRMCIGHNFASMEAGLVISALFKYLDFELLDESVDSLPQITLKQLGGLRVKFK